MLVSRLGFMPVRLAAPRCTTGTRRAACGMTVQSGDSWAAVGHGALPQVGSPSLVPSQAMITAANQRHCAILRVRVAATLTFPRDCIASLCFLWM
jgi:hypothetical protein